MSPIPLPIEKGSHSMNRRFVAVIVVTALQDARKNAPATGTTPGASTPTGPATLGTGYVVRPFSASDLGGRIIDNTFFA
jgi:hypothetical protein